MHAPQSSAQAEPSVEELRIAIALNGGVSLAVWMGGCAVELDRARRANRGAQDGRSVYDALCACFKRRLAIDILSGASAGGINGALLSAAMVKGRQLSPGFIRNRWLDLADLSGLLHDPQDPKPTALMDGRKFHEALVASFRELLEGNGGALGPNEKAIVSVPSLDVTMTDVKGVPHTFVDAWGNELSALEHRPRFQFRHPDDFSTEALAEAARTSASFPVAFEPWPVESAWKLAGLRDPTFGIDGGLLDNAPIRAALDLIPSKPASSRVRRYVCYVNGDPSTFAPKAAGDPPPSLRQVGGYVVSLPRSAPFIDHLHAIQRAVERPRLVDRVQLPLLELPLEELLKVANALLPAYRQRRARASLEELTDEPAEVKSMSRVLEKDPAILPWIPASLDVPTRESWDWGIRTAQRVLHLLLDLLRPAVAAAPAEMRSFLLERRMEIDQALELLIAAHRSITSKQVDRRAPTADISARLATAIETAEAEAGAAYDAVESGAKSFFAALSSADATLFPEDLGAQLFGQDPKAAPTFGGEALSHCLKRVLAIEVVRRGLAEDADIESAQSLQFVQLTPTAPAPIFAYPNHPSGPTSAATKLTGIGLGHFAGFHRRSWRANDFMWGRLDAAARIVDLLLDSPDPDGSTSARGVELAQTLLAVEPHDERDWLIGEALAESGNAGLAQGLWEKDEQEQEALIAGLIEAELDDAGDGRRGLRFTRGAFQRIAQLEVVREELPIVSAASKRDRELGSAARALKLGGDGSGTKAEIETVREIYGGGGTLPGQLTHEGEIVSDLSLRTITRAAFVSLAAVRGAGMPLAKLFGLVRPPLLAVAGSVAQSWYHRATAWLGFWATAAFLTSRLVSTETVAPAFGDAWSLATLAAAGAVLGVGGIAAVPGLRALRGPDRAQNGAWAVALAGFAFVFAAALAVVFGSLDLEQLLFAPEADGPSECALLLVLVAVGVVSFARLPLLRPLRRLMGFLRGERTLCAVLAGAFVLLGVESASALADGWDRGWWEAVSVCFAAVGAPIAAGIRLSLTSAKKA